MFIHVVEAGESILSIANKHKISEQRLILQNGLSKEESLIIGQTIVIAKDKETYTTVEGDTTHKIAVKLGIEDIELIRNNPFLINRDVIQGETLVISYEDKKKSTVTTNGYTYPFISREVLIKTLPYLSYLSIYEYLVMPDGKLSKIEDEWLIELAKSYGVAPLMVISGLVELNDGSESIDIILLTKKERHHEFIQGILDKLENKGYYGLNLYMEQFESKYIENMVYLLHRIKRELNDHGYYFMVTITPNTIIDKKYEDVDYKKISDAVNGILMVSYEWGYASGPTEYSTPMPIISKYLEHASKHIPPDKMNIGVPILAYNWELPYGENRSNSHAISVETALHIARETGAIIQYDDISQSPYIEYTMEEEEKETTYVIWFKDARSLEVIGELILDYGLQGIAIWNIMNYFPQLWTILNTQYEIERIDLNEFKNLKCSYNEELQKVAK